MTTCPKCKTVHSTIWCPNCEHRKKLERDSAESLRILKNREKADIEERKRRERKEEEREERIEVAERKKRHKENNPQLYETIDKLKTLFFESTEIALQAEKFLLIEKFEDALLFAEKAIEKNPFNTKANYLLAKSSFLLGKYGSAYDYSKNTIKLIEDELVEGDGEKEDIDLLLQSLLILKDCIFRLNLVNKLNSDEIMSGNELIARILRSFPDYISKSKITPYDSNPFLFTIDKLISFYVQEKNTNKYFEETIISFKNDLKDNFPNYFSKINILLNNLQDNLRKSELNKQNYLSKFLLLLSPSVIILLTSFVFFGNFFNDTPILFILSFLIIGCGATLLIGGLPAYFAISQNKNLTKEIHNNSLEFKRRFNDYNRLLDDSITQELMIKEVEAQTLDDLSEFEQLDPNFLSIAHSNIENTESLTREKNEINNSLSNDEENSENSFFISPVNFKQIIYFIIFSLIGVFAINSWYKSQNFNSSDSYSSQKQSLKTESTTHENPIATASLSNPDANSNQKEINKEAIKTELSSIINKWQEIKRKAFISSDTSELSSVLSDTALEEAIGGINWWKEHGTYTDISLHSLEILEINILSETNAEVKAKISETKTNSEEGTKKSDYTATYFFYKSDNLWKISSIMAN